MTNVFFLAPTSLGAIHLDESLLILMTSFLHFVERSRLSTFFTKNTNQCDRITFILILLDNCIPFFENLKSFCYRTIIYDYARFNWPITSKTGLEWIVEDETEIQNTGTQVDSFQFSEAFRMVGFTTRRGFFGTSPTTSSSPDIRQY